jgi:putative hemolysin
MARRSLPPLIKGYLRLGCFIGDGAVVDDQFGTTDVFILLPVERVTKRYSMRFGTPGAINDGEAEAAEAIGGRSQIII